MRGLRRPRGGALVEAGVVVAGIVALGLFYGPALRGETSLGHDHLYWGVPVYRFFAESLALWRLPIWNPFTHGGEPFYIPLFQLRLLDPPAVLVALLGSGFGTDPITLYAWDRFARGVVIGVGSYLVLRLWAHHLLTRLSLIPLVFLSSMQWSLVRQMAIAEQFLVAPFVLLFFLRVVYLGDNRWRNWLAGALLFGLGFQSYFFAGITILLTAFAGGLWWFRRGVLRRLWRRPGLVGRLAAAAAIIAVMLLPSAVLLTETNRFIFPPRVVDYEYQDRGPNQGPPQYEPKQAVRSTRPLLFPYRLQFHVGTYSAPVDFVQLLAPLGNEFARPSGYPWGKPSEAFMYVGMLPLAVALLGMVAGRHSLKGVWFVVLATTGLLMMGPQAFAHAALYWIFPPLWFARNMHTLALFFVLALLYFYVLGCDRLLRRGAAALPLGRAEGGARVRAAAIVGLSAAVFVTVVTLSRVRYPLTFYTLPMLAALAALGWRLRPALGPRGLFWSILVGWSAGVAVLAVRAGDRTSVLFLLCFLIVPLLTWSSWVSPSPRLRRLGVVLAFVGAVGLLAHRVIVLARGGPAGLGLGAGVVLAMAGAAVGALLLVLVAREVFGSSPRQVSRLGLLAGLLLVSTLDVAAYSGYLKPLVEGPRPDRTVPMAAADTGGFPATRVVTVLSTSGADHEQAMRYGDLMWHVPAALSPFFTAPDLPIDLDPARLIEALLRGDRASTFLMTRDYYDLLRAGASGARLAEVFAVGRPLVELRPDWVWLGRRDTRRALAEPARALPSRGRSRHPLILDQGPAAADWELQPDPPERNRGAPGRWDVRRYDYNSVDLEVDAPVRQALYWSDGFDRYWRAWVDGEEVPVHRANLAFKAVLVPAGRHVVRFAYRPTPIVITGLLFVAMGFAGCAVAIWALTTPRVDRPALDRVSLTDAGARR